MIRMEKLMVLGASYSLVPLIEAAKRLGCYTVATSIPGDYPGFYMADEICCCDITKPEEILRQARRMGIAGIATCCMDVGLCSQGYTASRMGLCGPSWETVRMCTDKYEMKKAFRRAGVNTADFRKVESEKDLLEAAGELHFPLIIKAVDQMGSRGIFRCGTEEELLRYYPLAMAATQKSYCIVEEFLEGTMFGAEAMVESGRLAFLLPVGNDLHGGNPPFPIGHYAPWPEADALEDAIREQAQSAVRALGADNCPMDFDMMLKDGKVYVIEATARAGATGLAELVGIHFGVDYYEAIVRLAMGRGVAGLFERPKSRRTPGIVRLLESKKAGIVERVIPGTQTGGNLVDLSFNIQKGDRVRLMENGRDRIGQVIVKGDALPECRAFLEGVLERIQVEVRDEDGCEPEK